MCLNADPAAAALITHGNERVLEGRLDDAEFSYDRDLAEGLAAMAARLSEVVFHPQLGSLADKSARLHARPAPGGVGRRARRALKAVAAAADLALTAPVTGELPAAVIAARHAKADLVSQVVIEFPSLQGQVGGVYAAKAGAAPAVAQAIAEHYKPLSAVAPIPGTLAGGLVAIAEKIDNIAGAWLAAEKPSGSRDPYGLRRAARGSCASPSRTTSMSCRATWPTLRSPSTVSRARPSPKATRAPRSRPSSGSASKACC